MSKIIVHDMTLRDGMHPQRHQTSIEQMIAITANQAIAAKHLLVN